MAKRVEEARLRGKRARARRPDEGGAAPEADGGLCALPNIAIEWVTPSELQLPARRLRKHGSQQIGQLAASIRAFGFLIPLVISDEGEVITGEARLEAALTLGLERIPVIRARHLSQVEIRQFRVADNRLAERADWNDRELRLELAELVVLMPELNFEMMGMTLPELDVAIGVATDASEASDTVAVSRGPAVSRLGDVFEVRGHRIICGDACLAQTYDELMRGERIAVVFADGPWNVKIQGHVGGKGRIRHAEFVMASGDMSHAEFLGFQTAWLKRLADICRPGTLIYCAIDWRGLPATLAAANEAGLEQINLCVWTKTNAGMGSFYRSAHELFPVFRVPGAAHLNNIELGRNGRYRANCWSYAGANVTGIGREALALHPTPKPVPLVADILLDCSKRRDIVLDPFGGSGASLIAAERTGRYARLIELDPLYVDTMVRRFEEVFGEAPLHVGTGLALDALARVRGGEGGQSTDAPRPRRRPRRQEGARDHAA